MDFELWWLLVIIPVTFALGWWGARIDLRQWKTAQLDAPRAYFKGLNFLLNEQQDKAIDAFIEAVQYDSDTSDLHFALGNLFRKRGEYERAVRVHQHLVGRADLPPSERDRAQYALALDYLKAGLLDHAEKALTTLKEIPAYTNEVCHSLLALYERSRDWEPAIGIIQMLEERGESNLSPKKAHYYCELAAEAKKSQTPEQVLALLEQARQVSPESPRPLLELVDYYLSQSKVGKAFVILEDLLRVAPLYVALSAPHISQLTHNTELKEERLQWQSQARKLVEAAYAQENSLDLLMMLLGLEENHAQNHAYIMAYLEQHPSIIASAELVHIMQDQEAAPSKELVVVGQTLQRAAKRLDRYRCQVCGFETMHYFWQCPGCSHWDSYPPKRIEEL